MTFLNTILMSILRLCSELSRIPMKIKRSAVTDTLTFDRVQNTFFIQFLLGLVDFKLNPIKYYIFGGKCKQKINN